MIDSKKQRKAAEKFVEMWRGKTNEDEHAVQFWDELLQLVYEVEHPSQYINHEKKVRINGKPKRIDGYIRETLTLIEQKSGHVNLDLKDSQSDHVSLTPFEQAERYGEKLDKDEQPRWIVVCNFHEFRVYDMNHRSETYERILFEELPQKAHFMNFLVDEKRQELKREEKEVSRTAGELMGEFYNAMMKRIPGNPTFEDLQGLNVLCVRLVFCLYAEDAGIFSDGLFREYLVRYSAEEIREQLIILFARLRNPEDRYLKPELKRFPYVKGLFEQQKGEENFPLLDDTLKTLLLDKLSKFNWSHISPANFGAVFESTLDPVTRRNGGMHYTDVENIHKVIDPLFLNDLRAELEQLKSVKGKSAKVMKTMVEQYQQKLAEVTCFDPACGSGNFLTETYLSLRRLENEAILLYTHGQKSMGDFKNPVRVSISQFYGIEINGFAAKVARTALWIAESQMRKETEKITELTDEYLPLTRYANIMEGNALRTDWEAVAPKDKVKYIIGNPPFVNASGSKGEEQKKEIKELFGKLISDAGNLDYVSGWYLKACTYMQGTDIRCSFVSTNSITQGEQVESLWRPLVEQLGLKIDFAWRSFVWKSEAKNKANVHCVIVGFSCGNIKTRKVIFDEYGTPKNVSYINAYLYDYEDVWIRKRKTEALRSDAPFISKGFQATDNGCLILSREEKEEIVSKEPESEKWIRVYCQGEDFINGDHRYCLWLTGIEPHELRQLKQIRARVEKCKTYRESAPKSGDAYKLREIPHLFRPCKQFRDEPYIAIPLLSSVNRKYIPIGYVENGMIPGNNLFCIFGASLYDFGVLTSRLHNLWVLTIGGRFKSDPRYSKEIVYHNFPWPSPSDDQRKKIEQAAKMILTERAYHPKSTLEDLYDPLMMEVNLRKAHLANDCAVLDAYGLPYDISEEDCVKHLFKLYKAFSEKSQK